MWVCAVGAVGAAGGSCSVLLPALPLLGGGGLCCPPTPPCAPAQAKYKAREAAMKAQSEKKHGSDKEERGKLPESPKTAEEIWQQSVIGDYLARFKVGSGQGQELALGLLLPPAGIALHLLPCSHTLGNWLGLGAMGRGGLPARERVPCGPWGSWW